MPHYRLHRDPRSSHQQIARLVRQAGRGPILDVGAAQGLLGQLLRGTPLAAELDGVEPNLAWAAAARPLYRQLFATTVEAANLPAGAYHTIVCGDVLEHVVDPVAVLRRLQRAAAPDALFIVSLPNVAHLAVRLLLLTGSFPPMERGILDRTHLHFYTRDTAEALLRSAGLVVLTASPTGIPVEEVWPGRKWRPVVTLVTRLQHAALALAPRLFGFQWIFTARPVGLSGEGFGEPVALAATRGAGPIG